MAPPPDAWPLGIAAYMGVALESTFRNVMGADRIVTTKAGAEWSARMVYEPRSLVTVLTIVFVALPLGRNTQ